jgi:Spy/CpxP family protein refolding chaperone
LVSATKRLNLTARQEAQIHEAIERADAGAAVLIKHEQDLRQMVAATTPQDPLYAKLISEQAGNADRWNENREGLRQEVMGILTDQQRTKFEQTQAQR